MTPCMAEDLLHGKGDDNDAQAPSETSDNKIEPIPGPSGAGNSQEHQRLHPAAKKSTFCTVGTQL